VAYAARLLKRLACEPAKTSPQGRPSPGSIQHGV
jgi:hypothetical protein